MGVPCIRSFLRISQQPASAEEIVQDVFLQLWRSADRFQISRGPLEPWLFTMARNRALDFLRLKREKQRRREDSSGSRFSRFRPLPGRIPRVTSIIRGAPKKFAR